MWWVSGYHVGIPYGEKKEKGSRSEGPGVGWEVKKAFLSSPWGPSEPGLKITGIIISSDPGIWRLHHLISNPSTPSTSCVIWER